MSLTVNYLLDRIIIQIIRFIVIVTFILCRRKREIIMMGFVCLASKLLIPLQVMNQFWFDILLHLDFSFKQTKDLINSFSFRDPLVTLIGFQQQNWPDVVPSFGIRIITLHLLISGKQKLHTLSWQHDVEKWNARAPSVINFEQTIYYLYSARKEPSAK